MKVDNRRQEIIDLLVEEGGVTLDALALRFGVSKMTIHRDLDELDAEGFLRKVRGGATIESSGQFESDFRYRKRVAAEEKFQIAKKAADFIEPGMSVMVDDGSTSQSIVPFLIEKRPLTVITNNYAIIKQLIGQAGISLIALGGNYSEKFNGFFGIVTNSTLDGLRADICFISSSSIHSSTAFHQDQEVVEVKRKMMSVSAKCYLMVDHQKFGRTALHYFCELLEFNGVITSNTLSSEICTALIDGGINLHLAQEESL